MTPAEVEAVIGPLWVQAGVEDFEARRAEAQRLRDEIGRRGVATAKVEAERDGFHKALTTVQRLVDLPAEQIMDDAERVRRIKLVVDTTLHEHGS